MPSNFHFIEGLTIGTYLVAMILVALAFRKFNANASDYFRCGCRGTWWLVGVSAMMGAFSAWTFTGAAGVAYQYGWSIFALISTGFLPSLLAILFLAPWFRQLRTITAPEVVRMRFGTVTQQLYGWFTLVLQFLSGGVQLYAVSVFTAAVFSIDVRLTVLLIGGAVLIYSLIGGAWAVMAADFIQFLIVLPITLLVAFLAIQAVGGVGGFLKAIEPFTVTGEYSFLKPSGFVDAPVDFSIWWFVAMLAMVTISQSSLINAPRFMAAKDGREARKAAVVIFATTLVGSLIWIIPPMVARVLIPEQVAASSLANPVEASYALLAMKLLPAGMTGLLVVTMFAATMSGIDSGLNRNAAIFVNDIYPEICRWLRRRPSEGRRLLLYGEIVTLFFGILMILVAYYYATIGVWGIFTILQVLIAVVAVPLYTPFFWGLFVQRVPWWSALFSIGCGSAISLGGFLATKTGLPFLPEQWKWHSHVLLTLAVGTLAFFVTMPFWKSSSPAFREQVRNFFEVMRRPVDFEREVGAPLDSNQFRIIGGFAAVLGFLVCLLALLPNPASGRVAFLFVGGLSLVLGLGFLLWAARLGRGK